MRSIAHNGMKVKQVKKRAWTFWGITYNNRGEQKELYLTQVSDIPIRRHVKVKGNASPDDPDLKAYWLERRQRKRGATVDYPQGLRA